MKRLENESVKEFLNRIPIKDSTWIVEAKRRQKYRFFYNIKFKLQLFLIKLKKYSLVERIKSIIFTENNKNY